MNVGGRNRVPMAELRALVERLGGEQPRTYVQSGNVVFAHAERDRGALAAMLEQAIAEEFGVRSPVVLRTGDELAAVIHAHPYGTDTSKSHVCFLPHAPAPDRVAALAELDVAPEAAEVRGEDVYLHYPDGAGRARLSGPLLERRLGVAGTARNWRTVTALAEMARGDQR